MAVMQRSADSSVDHQKARNQRYARASSYSTDRMFTLLNGYCPVDAWYRHTTLAMLAHAYLAVTAATAPKALAATSSRSRSARSAVSWHT